MKFGRKWRVMATMALILSTAGRLGAASRIEDPKAFVAEQYRQLMAKGSRYTAPGDIYTARLGKLLQDDRRRAKGEVGCLDFDFWVNGDDWEITKLTITSADQGQDRKTITARFLNTGEPQEIQFDFRREAGRWLMDEVRSMLTPKWSLSEILKCTP